MSRHVFTYLRSFRYRASTFADHLILRPSSSSPSSPPPPPPPPSSSSASASSSSTSSFSTFHQRRLVVLLSSFLVFFLPALLPLIPHDQTTTTATNNHLVPLRCRERRCRCARRLIFGRTFRFGVLYWTVQKWHLPVSELTSCQVSVSFARAVPGRRRVYASACIYVRSHACCVCVYTCMRVAPQTRLFPHSIRDSIWPLSRARALDHRHTSVIAVRSLVGCAYRAYVVACVCVCVLAAAADARECTGYPRVSPVDDDDHW